MRRGLREVYPEIFSTLLVPKEPELVATPYRFDGDKDAAIKHFEGGLAGSFGGMWRITSSDYPLTVFYAFKQAEAEDDQDDEGQQVISSTGWETMLEGLIHAGFTIDGTWPVRSERTTGIKGLTNMLASSIVLVCRSRPDNAPTIARREFVNGLRCELPAALLELQSGSIAPVDLAQASIGPGMAVYSRYRKVLEANGEALSVRTALQLINQELDAYLAEQEGDVDADTRFAVNWFEQYGFREGEFGVADVLARAKNTSVEGVANAGVVVAGGGKVRLLTWEEIRPDWDPSTDRRPTVWEAVHHLIERINTHGESGAAALLLKMKADVAAEAHTLAYRLYSVCERKGWADIARDYNALVVSWPRLQELANELRQNQPPEQVGLF
jgi:putative DNA methylase